jgi:hypothetical protein
MFNIKNQAKIDEIVAALRACPQSLTVDSTELYGEDVPVTIPTLEKEAADIISAFQARFASHEFHESKVVRYFGRNLIKDPDDWYELFTMEDRQYHEANITLDFYKLEK